MGILTIIQTAVENLGTNFVTTLTAIGALFGSS